MFVLSYCRLSNYVYIDSGSSVTPFGDRENSAVRASGPFGFYFSSPFVLSDLKQFEGLLWGCRESVTLFRWGTVCILCESGEGVLDLYLSLLSSGERWQYIGEGMRLSF